MLSQVAIGLLLVAAQLDRPIIPELPGPPDDVEEVTWIVTMSDGSTEVGFMQESRNRIQVMFYPDTPWETWPYKGDSLIADRVQADEEGAARRKARHDRLFPENNYTLVDGSWIPNEIVEPAQRAHELYVAAEKRRAKEFEVASPDSPMATSTVANVEPPRDQGGAQRWGAHVLIGLGALIAAAIVARLTFLAG